MDLIISVPRAHVEPSSLDNLVERFLELFVHAFGFEWMTPKFHWLLHFGDHLEKWHILLNCFVLERRHRIAKRYATELKNISKDASQSLLMEVTSHHLSLLRSPQVFNYAVGLVGGRPASKKARDLLNTMLECITPEIEVHTSSEARFNALAHCQKGDVVLIRHDSSFIVGQVLLDARVEGALWSCAIEWSLHAINMGAGYAA